MSKLVTELHIIGENGNMFDTDMEYIIPLIPESLCVGGQATHPAD